MMMHITSSSVYNTSVQPKQFWWTTAYCIMLYIHCAIKERKCLFSSFIIFIDMVFITNYLFLFITYFVVATYVLTNNKLTITVINYQTRRVDF